MKKNLLLFILPLLFVTNSGSAQCAAQQNVFAFTYNGKAYEIIKENKTWVNAAACAVSRGGYLAEVNSAAENEAIFSQLSIAGVNPDDTAAPDGFSSYVWLGGNDITTEGSWFWNGDNNLTGIPFWVGNANGNAVSGRFTNWGNEPDNWGSGSGQDGLGMAVIDWPLGTAGHWNDVSHNNTLFFVVEYDTTMAIEKAAIKNALTLHPAIATDVVTITTAETITGVAIYTPAGQEVQSITATAINNGVVSVANLPAGMYVIAIQLNNNVVVTKKIIKM